MAAISAFEVPDWMMQSCMDHKRWHVIIMANYVPEYFHIYSINIHKLLLCRRLGAVSADNLQIPTSFTPMEIMQYGNWCANRGTAIWNTADMKHYSTNPDTFHIVHINQMD